MRLLVVIAPLVLAQNTSPVTRVVTLIKELKERIVQDEKEETNAWNRYACWCENTLKRKADTIDSTRTDIGKAGVSILKNRSNADDAAKQVQELTDKIKDKEGQIKSLQETRAKENKAYRDSNKELSSYLEGLQRAVQKLQGAGTTEKRDSLLQLKGSLNSALRTGHLAGRTLALVEQFIQAPTADDGSASYSPASATIQGVLKDMYTAFAQDIQEQTIEEAKQAALMEGLVKDAQDTIDLATKRRLQQEERRDKHNEKAASQQEIHGDLNDILSEDDQFFRTAATACEAKKDAWDKRQKARSEELKGIEEALTILTSDKARNVFKDSIQPGYATPAADFLQLNSNSVRGKAYRELRRAARAAHSLRLATLAAMVQMKSRGGRFDAVFKAIDDMVQQLKDEEAKDIKQRDTCNKTQHERSEEKKNQVYLARVAQEKSDIAAAEKEQAETDLETSERKEQEAKDLLASLLQTRTDENDAFKVAKDLDQQAISLLTDALVALKKFYEPKAEGKLLQAPEFEVSEDQAPEATFSKDKHRESESRGIISTLEMIKQDLKNEIKQAQNDEEASQLAFEAQERDINKLVEKLNKEQVTLEGTITTADETIVEENEKNTTHTENANTKQDEIDTDAPGCDHLNATFHQRLEKRRLEREGLENAKALLAAAPNLVQRPSSEQVFLSTSFRHMA